MAGINVYEGDGTIPPIIEPLWAPVIAPRGLLLDVKGLARLHGRSPYRGSLWISLAETDAKRVARDVGKRKPEYAKGIFLNRDPAGLQSLALSWKIYPHVHRVRDGQDYLYWLATEVTTLRLWNRGRSGQPPKGYLPSDLYDAVLRGEFHGVCDSCLGEFD